LKRTLAFGGVVATAGLLASALAIPASADPAPAGQDPVGATVAAKNPWRQAALWLANNGRMMIDAQEYQHDYVKNAHTERLNSAGGFATTKPGLIPAIGEEKKKASKSKNINVPRTTGRVFFTRNGKPYTCSGTSLQSRYRNIVATAGHCAYNTDDDDHILDNWVFVPMYYDGKAPEGIYIGKQAWVHYDFSVYEDYDRDYAFVSVYNGIKIRGIHRIGDHTIWDKWLGPKDTIFHTNENGTIIRDKDGKPRIKWYTIYTLKDAGRLGDNVGGQGFAYNLNPKQKVFVFGYPTGRYKDGNRPYTGLTTKWCYGTTNKIVKDAKLKIEEQIGLKCAATPGMNGAPFLTRYNNAKRLGYWNGTVSTFIDTDKNDRYDMVGSPYIDGEARDVYAKAANTWSGKLIFDEVVKVPHWAKPTPTPTPTATASPSATLPITPPPSASASASNG
jgi:hypothetical protein